MPQSKNLRLLSAKRFNVAAATNQLCKTTSLDKLSVNEICEQSGISRASFYNLFNSKFDIPLWCQEVTHYVGTREIGRTVTILEGSRICCEGCLMFKDLMRESSLSKSGISISDNGFALGKNHLIETLEWKLGEPISEDHLFQVEYSSAAAAYLIDRWLAGAYSYNAEKMAEMIADCFPSTLRKILDTPVEHHPVETFDIASFFNAAHAKEQ